MKNIRHEIGLWCQAVVFIGLWVLLIYVAERDLRITFGALKEIPHVVFIYAIIYVLFTTWAWRWRMFSGWLIPFPDLEGTWRGTIVSTWRNPETGQAPPPIEAMLVIRQKFDSISCTLFTAESESQSNAAALQLEEGSDRKILSLAGEYWTSRKTTGEMDFGFESRAVLDTFATSAQNAR